MTVGTAFERIAFGRTSERPGVQVNLRPTTLLVGRIMLGLIFVASGVLKLADWSGTIAFMTENGIKAVPGLFLAAAALVEIIGGLSVMGGVLARIGAAILFVYLIPTTLIFHDFWNLEGAAAGAQMTSFLKNVAIMGGLLVLMSCGAGRISVDRRLEARSRPAGRE